jgi:hypothetical protein
MPQPCRARARARFGALAALIVVPLLATVGSSPASAATTAPTAFPSLHTDREPLVDGLRTPSLQALTAQSTGVADNEATHQFSQSGLAPFVAIGFSWDGPAGAQATLVLTYADGEVTAPIDVDQDDAHGEDTSKLGDRRVSAPVALDKPAVAYSVTFPAELTNIDAHFVREDTVAASPPPIANDTITTAAAADGIPGPDGIRSRESWGARPRKLTEPCAPGGRPEGLGCVATNGVVNAVVHHTVNANDYSAASVPALLRSIQAFHQDVQQFDDIGYNFVVDRFGTIWEGRAGGADRPVVGGHTMGFNTGSVGVAVLGTFDGAAPNEAELDGVARVIAWKFAQRNVDPLGQLTVISNGGDIHPEGVPVVLNTIDGHRSIGATACPGALLFARLDDIRQRVAALMPLYTGEVSGLDRTGGQIRLSGYALRRDTATPVAVSLVIDGATVGQTVANIARSDVASRFGPIGANHGFEFVVPVTLSMRQACVVENLTGTLIGCRDVNPVTPAFGDFGFTTTASPPRIGLSGWLIDPDSSEPTVAHVYLDGVFAGQFWADRPRADIAAVYPGYGINRGFSTDIATTQGAHQMCVFAINIPSGSHTLLGCREVIVGQVNRSAPTGSLDVAVGAGASVIVSGWAFDRDTTDPINVHVYVDDTITPIVAANARPDVAAVIPGAPARAGFSARVAATPGPHTVCVYAIDANLVGPHTQLGCRAVTVLAPNATPPVGALDAVTAANGLVSASGWAIDPDTTAQIDVHVYVDATGTVGSASLVRTDVAVASPGSGPAHGFMIFAAVGRGAHQVCAYAINNLPGAANTLLGCRTITVA